MIVCLHPSTVAVFENRLQVLLPNGGSPHLVCVLRTVHLLNEQLICAWHKIHAGQIVVTLISRDG